MENNQSFNRGNPLVVAAATSVLVFSLVGIGVFTGVIPNAASNGNGMFFNAATAAQLQQAFQQIADSLPAVLIK